MARVSKIIPVREFLIEAYTQAEQSQEKLARTEEYEKAAMVKSFKDVLFRAIELCGEDKLKEGKNATKSN